MTTNHSQIITGITQSVFLAALCTLTCYDAVPLIVLAPYVLIALDALKTFQVVSGLSNKLRNVTGFPSDYILSFSKHTSVLLPLLKNRKLHNPGIWDVLFVALDRRTKCLSRMGERCLVLKCAWCDVTAFRPQRAVYISDMTRECVVFPRGNKAPTQAAERERPNRHDLQRLFDIRYSGAEIFNRLRQ
jgi:hypothetical protein